MTKGTVDFMALKQITRVNIAEKVFEQLRDQGYPVSDSIYTLEYAKQELLRMLEERGVPHA